MNIFFAAMGITSIIIFFIATYLFYRSNIIEFKTQDLIILLGIVFFWPLVGVFAAILGEKRFSNIIFNKLKHFDRILILFPEKR